MTKSRNGFTLVEILVVLGIIALLAALLFPAFGRARESARQTNCQSNLQQISLAVNQYRKEEGRYPDSLVDLLGEGAKYMDGAGAPAVLGASAPGYLRAGQDSLICQDDDTDTTDPRSSYGSLKKSFPAAAPADFSSFTGDYGQYVWNYWGTRADGFTYSSAAEAETATWSKPGSHANPGTPPPTADVLMDPEMPYNSPATANYDSLFPINVIKYSMSNRFAPPSTIITHCVYHRIQTASDIDSPGKLYLPATTDAQRANTREIVARVEPKVKNEDVSAWGSQFTWQKQTP
jgi:prepilin-type N-terminal cleavage/methylation domain-containing protein